ncbi:MAG: hypothetical protein K8H88_24100 [Sandaracinaceae bacterium]|nr:hypothetical protein [Sandaracinaceae bacterium]
MRLCFVCLLIFASVLVGGCASNQCDFHSQCGTRRYCELGRCLQQCRMDFDCDPGQRCNEIGQCVASGGT